MDAKSLTAALSRHMPSVLRWSGALARQLRKHNIAVAGKNSGSAATDALTLADLSVQELIVGARLVIMKTVEESNAEEKSDWGVIKEKIRVDLKRYINKQTSKRPLILPVILEV